jgi:hypothetical protein
VSDVLIDHIGKREGVDIKLLVGHQMQKQVERSLEDIGFNGKGAQL